MLLAEFDLKSAGINYNTELTKAVWEGRDMRPEVGAALLRIAEKFIETLDYPEFNVFDIRIVGSAVNYNYSDFSDIDLHIVTDLRDYDSEVLAEKYFHARKSLWNDRHDIEIGPHDVEVYIEDLANPPKSGGLYSLVKKKWLKIPEYNQPSIDDSAVIAKANELMKEIDYVLGDTTENTDELEQVRTKIWKMRQAAIAENGEWAYENLAFKVLRNKGYLQKLIDAEEASIDQALSLK